MKKKHTKKQIKKAVQDNRNLMQKKWFKTVKDDFKTLEGQIKECRFDVFHKKIMDIRSKLSQAGSLEEKEKVVLQYEDLKKFKPY